MRSHHSIAQLLPDLPRWVEARDLLLAGDGEIFGFRDEPSLSLVLRDAGAATAFVIGAPAAAAIHIAVQDSARGSLIAPLTEASWLAQALPGWTRTRIILHTLGDPQGLPSASAVEVGVLDPHTLDQTSIAAELLGELKSAAEDSLIAATFVGKQPVSFCYAASETETLWDISIDTLPEHRRKGYAALCVAFMVRHMHATKGKRPVWQAVEENPASWRLAQKLGFVPVDELALFELRE